MQRVPFEAAINDKALFKNFFYGDGSRRNPGLTFPQQVTLKAFYGCELSAERINPLTGWNELDYWAIVQGSCKFDELGYVTEVIPIPYSPHEYTELWAIIGRRAGKSASLQSFVIAYEAALGGHDEDIMPGQECTIYLVAQKLDIAQKNMSFVSGILHSSPLIEKYIEGEIAGKITLKNGITIEPSQPSIKAQRGLACPILGLDEVSFWYKDAENANPDYEVIRALRWAQVQFSHKKRVGISSPWSKQGVLWDNHQAGTKGYKLTDLSKRDEYKDTLVCFGTTASFENPRVTRADLAKERLADLEGFERESLCIFPDSVSGFFSRELVERAAAKGHGISERPPVDWEKSKILPTYVAAMDPAFRKDSFGFGIGHRDHNNNLVLDVLRKWTPMKGKKNDPKLILTEIKQLCDLYKVDMVYSDQYQLEALQVLAQDMGFLIIGEDFTGKSKAKIFGSLANLTNQQKLVLLDPNIKTADSAADELVEQLIFLERKQMGMGNIRISAPDGKHDDMACMLALIAYFAVRLTPTIIEEVIYHEPTIFEIVMKNEAAKRRQLSDSDY